MTGHGGGGDDEAAREGTAASAPAGAPSGGSSAVPRRIRIATRESLLALAQTRWVAERLRALAPGLEVVEVAVKTQGDKILDKPLASIGGKGLFLKEVEEALLDGRAELAVHSMKDVPPDVAPGCVIAAVPEREDPHDVLVTVDGVELDDLEAGDKVGTSSLRRAAQLASRRPDLQYVTLRGNVQTRLRKLDEGKYRAIVLAAAGMRRLGLDVDRKHVVLGVDQSIPAVGQGALALEVRGDDEATRALVARLDDPVAAVQVAAERAFLSKLEGSCRTPIAGHATLEDGGARLSFRGMVASIDGQQVLTTSADRWLPDASDHEARVDVARGIGLEAAGAVLRQGAAEVIREAVAHQMRLEAQSNGGGARSGNWQ
ncbi:MAG TPA: hydroxymethylbilane synthase [Polyangiaceae bacterium LLY-WYZ-14_1]|nr:hydroxymethylbilane synthase [Polyangiaceae bacterium LLY-WYZ-14_1]